MPERNHEVVIDGYVFPDTVTVTLANDEYINSRDYVSKELYESVDGANDVWQAENAKLRDDADKIAKFYDEELKAALVENTDLRELVRDMMRFFEDGDWCTTCEQACKCESQEQYEEDCLMRDVFHDRMRELRVGVS